MSRENDILNRKIEKQKLYEMIVPYILKGKSIPQIQVDLYLAGIKVSRYHIYQASKGIRDRHDLVRHYTKTKENKNENE